MRQDGDIEIQSLDYLFKVVDFLNLNWALIAPAKDGVMLWLFGDMAGLFDEPDFESEAAGFNALKRRDFKRFVDDQEPQKFVAIPDAPFRGQSQPSGPIYSSGRFWN